MSRSVDEVVSTILFCASAIALTAAVCMRWRAKRLQDLEELLVTIRGLSSGSLDLRLDEEVEKRVLSGLNRTLANLGKRLWRAEQRGLEWEKALDAVEDVVCVVDGAGVIVRANKATAVKLDMDIRHVIGQHIQAYIQGERDPDADCPINLTATTKQAVVSYLGKCHFGEKMKMTTCPIDRPDGSSLMIAIVRDLDENGAKDSLNGFSRIVRVLPCAALSLDPMTGKVQSVNTAFTDLLGYAKPDFELDAIVSGDTANEVARIRRVAFKESEVPVEMELRHQTGLTLTCWVTGTMRRRATGAPSEMMLTILSERPKALASRKREPSKGHHGGVGRAGAHSPAVRPLTKSEIANIKAEKPTEGTPPADAKSTADAQPDDTAVEMDAVPAAMVAEKTSAAPSMPTPKPNVSLPAFPGPGIRTGEWDAATLPDLDVEEQMLAHLNRQERPSLTSVPPPPAARPSAPPAA